MDLKGTAARYARKGMQLLPQGRSGPIQLVSVKTEHVEDGAGTVVEKKSFVLDEGNLKHVMDQVELGTPVAIVSVVGALRSGKSFFLSCCLKSLEITNSDDAFQEGVLGGKDGEVDGFSWKGGAESHTQGMMVWSKPLIQEVDDGNGGRTEMAVLLVDTQGTFDHRTDPQLEACLFGLSTTLSSCQIFNISRQFRANDLSHLAVYLDCGTTANENKNADENESGDEPNDGAPFQRLEVLVRDWQNTDIEHLPGEEIRDKFLKMIDGDFRTATTDTSKVKGCFRDRIGYFGLPHPGKEVTSPSFDGDISKIDEKFRTLVNYYIKHVIFGKLKATNVPNLVYRGADDFVGSVRQWVELFSEGLTDGKLPSVGTWLGMKNTSDNHQRAEVVLDEFKKEMDEILRDYVDPGTLAKRLAEKKNDAVSKFNPCGDASIRKEAKQVLLEKLDKEADRMMRANALRGSFDWWGVTSISSLATSLGIWAGADMFAAYFVSTSWSAVFGTCATVLSGAGLAVGIFCGIVAAVQLAPVVAKPAMEWGKFIRGKALKWFSTRSEPEVPAVPVSPAPLAPVAATALWSDQVWPSLFSASTWVVVVACLMIYFVCVTREFWRRVSMFTNGLS